MRSNLLTSHMLDGEDYRKGALERFDDAGRLLRQERLGDAIYLAGRGPSRECSEPSSGITIKTCAKGASRWTRATNCPSYSSP